MLGRIHAQGASIDWRQLVGASTSRRIFAAAVTVGGATAVASLASIARELVVAASFGTSDVLDAFIRSFRPLYGSTSRKAGARRNGSSPVSSLLASRCSSLPREFSRS
jgi:hypothetical protein